MTNERSVRPQAVRAPAERSASAANRTVAVKEPTRADKYASPTPPAAAIPRGVYILLALSIAAIGTIMGITLLVTWRPVTRITIPVLVPEGYLLLSRAGGLVAYSLLWLSMALGISITSKLSRIWPGGPAAVDVHRYVSLLGLGFTLVHVLALLGDTLLDFSLTKALSPFSGSSYRPFLVGLMGKTGLYLMLLVGLSFYVRARLGHRLWRLIHYLSFVAFVLSLAHSVLAGTDSATIWAYALYITSVSSLLVLTCYRLWLLLRARLSAGAQRRAASKPPTGSIAKPKITNN
jgi:predicted ferric reductase